LERFEGKSVSSLLLSTSRGLQVNQFPHSYSALGEVCRYISFLTPSQHLERFAGKSVSSLLLSTWRGLQVNQFPHSYSALGEVCR